MGTHWRKLKEEYGWLEGQEQNIFLNKKAKEMLDSTYERDLRRICL